MEKDQILFNQNENGKYFYIVKSGVLELLSNNEHIKNFVEMDCFGEMALLQKNKRTGTVRTVTDSELYVLDGDIFRSIVKKINQTRLKERLYFIDMIPLVRSLDNIQKTNLAKLINLKTFLDQEKIIKEGENGDAMYIIKKGIVSCCSESREIRKLYGKDYFGHNSILIECKRSLDVISIGNSSCYVFSKETLIEALGNNYKDAIFFSIFKDSLLRNSFFSEIFTESQIEQIYEKFVLKKYKNKDVIFEAGIKSRKILLLIEGNIINVKIMIYFL